MGSKSAADRERDEQNAIAVGAIGLLAIGLYGFPQWLIGGMLGAGLSAIAPAGIDDPARRRSLRGLAAWSIGAGLVIGGLVLALRSPLGLEVEGRRFHRAWKSDGVDPSALIDYPWGWLPQSVAIALVVAGLFLLWRTRP